MKTLNKMKISFDSRSANESFSRSVVGAFAMTLDPTTRELMDIKTAVSEAVTNAIVHGYENEIKPIYITATIKEGNILQIKIRDKGKGIENIKKAMEPLYTSKPDEERTGLGFSVMESMMDKLKVSSTLGKGTTITMTKRIVSKGDIA